MPEKNAFDYGDLMKIAELSGYSYGYVRDVLVCGRRKNNVIIRTSELVKNSKNQISKQIAKIKQKVA